MKESRRSNSRPRSARTNHMDNMYAKKGSYDQDDELRSHEDKSRRTSVRMHGARREPSGSFITHWVWKRFKRRAVARDESERETRIAECDQRTTQAYRSRRREDANAESIQVEVRSHECGRAGTRRGDEVLVITSQSTTTAFCLFDSKVDGWDVGLEHPFHQRTIRLVGAARTRPR